MQFYEHEENARGNPHLVVGFALSPSSSVNFVFVNIIDDFRNRWRRRGIDLQS